MGGLVSAAIGQQTMREMSDPVGVGESRHGGPIRSALANLGWLLAGRGATAMLSLVYLGLTTRALGIEDFGRFALVTGAAQALSVLVGFQTWQVVVRYGIEHAERGDRTALARLYRACLALDGLSAVTGLAIAAVLIATLPGQFGISPGLLRDAVILIAVKLLTIRSTPLGILRQTERFRVASLAEAVTPIVRLIGTIAAATWMPTLGAFLWVWALAEIATAAAFWIVLVPGGEVGSMLRARTSWPQLRHDNPQIGRFVVNSNMASTLGLATKQLPLLFVGGVAGPAAAGAFRIALQIAQALAKLAQLIARAIFPEMVRALKQPARAPARTALRRIFAITGTVSLIILAAVLTAGDRLLVLIGGDPMFAAGYGLLVWLAVAGAIDLAVVALEPLLLALGRSGATTAARLCGVGVQFAVMALLMPRFGALGSAVGVLGASLTSAACLVLAVRRYLPPARSG